MNEEIHDDTLLFRFLICLALIYRLHHYMIMLLLCFKLDFLIDSNGFHVESSID